MRFFIPLFLLSLSAFAAPSVPSFADAEVSSNSTLESRTFYCPSGTNWKITKCCPHDAIEKLFKCVCVQHGETLSADGRRCEKRCSQSGWNWCNTQCCPPGSDEVHGQCKCSGGKQLVGSGSNKKCVAQCPAGSHFGKTKCCPSGATEQWDKSCKCDSSTQKLSDDKSRCIDKCPSGWNACESQCCPPGSSEKHGQCVCDDSRKTIVGSGHDRKCGYNCPSGTHFKSTKCCPADSFEMHGKCQCNDPSKKPSADGSRCEAKCTNPSEHYSNGVCCKSYLTGKDGKCACPTTGQIDDGTKCSACPSGQNYNWITKKCDAPCSKAGTSYKVTRKGKGVCCRSGHTACNTVCCPSGTDEVGTSGKCCKAGSTLDPHGNCLEPSPAAGTGHRKRTLPIREVASGPAQIQLGAISEYLGLASNAGNALCPSGTAACPIEGVSSSSNDEYECIDTSSDLQSCGGCASMDQGVDCTLIPGARFMGCVRGQCEVYSCAKGFKLVNGACQA